MALKGHLWFLGRCLDEERNRSDLSHLASRILDLGLKRAEATRGHVFQAVGALQNFYSDQPGIVAAVRATSPFYPYGFQGAELDEWLDWFSQKFGSGGYGRAAFNYNYDTLHGYLTPRYGGRRTGGGGGDNEFELVARLLAAYI